MSTKEQVEGASLDAQKDAITAFASQNNLSITKWFEEHETASKAGRHQFDAMMQSLSNGGADGVIMHRIDRSSRNYKDWARIDEVSRMGIKIFFAADGLDFESCGGRLMADIQMVLAAHYSRNLSLEVKKGLYGRIKNGIFPFRAPIGYIDSGEGALKTLDPMKAPLVKTAFELYCSGEYSITSLTEEMRSQGLKGWSGRLVVRRNIETMLKNPFYIGKMLIRETLYEAAHEPLISVAQFQQVKAIKLKRIQKKSTKHGFLFRGLVNCGDCGRMITGERQKNHIYYRCHTSGCPNGTLREDRLEAQLLEQLKRLQIAPELQLGLTERLKTWLNSDGNDQMKSSLQLRLADAATRQDRLTDLLVDGAITKADFEVRKQNTEFECARLREELGALAKYQKTEADLGALVDLARNVTSTFHASLPTEQRRLIRNCTAKMTTCQGVLVVDPAVWLATLHKMSRDDDYTPTPEGLGLLCAGLKPPKSLAR